MLQNILKNKLILVIVGIILFYVIFAFFSDIEKLSQNFSDMNIIYLLPIVGILASSLFCRGLVQKFLLSEIGINVTSKQSFVLFLSGLSMIVTPAGSGQMIKSHFLKEKYGHSISKTLPLTITERFHDLLSITILIIITLFFTFSLGSFISIIISSGIIIVIIFIAKNEIIFKKLIQILGKIKFLNPILPSDFEFITSLQKLFAVKIILKTTMIVSPLFFYEGLIIYFGFLAFDTDIGYLKSVQLFYTSIIYGVLSLIPGGVGVVEGGFTALLTKENISISLAISIVIFVRLSTIWFATCVGFIASYLMSKKHNKSNL